MLPGRLLYGASAFSARANTLTRLQNRGSRPKRGGSALRPPAGADAAAAVAGWEPIILAGGRPEVVCQGGGRHQAQARSRADPSSFPLLPTARLIVAAMRGLKVTETRKSCGGLAAELGGLICAELRPHMLAEKEEGKIAPFSPALGRAGWAQRPLQRYGRRYRRYGRRRWRRRRRCG